MEQLIKKAHGMAKEKGFWDSERNKSELLMLIVSELSEALEALRKNHYANKKAVDDPNSSKSGSSWFDAQV
jgi:NTP pyrophosphatase (non-canonical NTP hydrolase)